MSIVVPEIPEAPLIGFSPRVAELLRNSGLDVVITGGGGWIGQAMIEMLEFALGPGFRSRVHVFGASRRAMRLRSGTQIDCRALGELSDLRIGPHVVAHLAFVTREHVSARRYEDYITENELISQTMLDHISQSDVVGLFLPSTGAVYGEGRILNAEIRSNPYGALKLRDEERFGDVGVPSERVAVIRIFNLAGQFLNKPEHYALGSILTGLRSDGRIRLRADHPVTRSYVHVRDVVDLAFAVMMGVVRGPSLPFDTAGELVVEVGELAVACATLLGFPEIQIERPAFGGGVPDRYVGDGTAMRQLATSLDLVPADLDTQILDTASYLWNHSG